MMVGIMVTGRITLNKAPLTAMGAFQHGAYTCCQPVLVWRHLAPMRCDGLLEAVAHWFVYVALYATLRVAAWFMSKSKKLRGPPMLSALQNMQ